MITATSIRNVHKYDVQMNTLSIRRVECVNLLESHGKNADVFRITLKDGENIVDLQTSQITGSAYFTNVNGTTTTISGTVYTEANGSYIEFKLPQTCYGTKGRCEIVFVLEMENGIITTTDYENRAVMIITGNVL